MKTFLINFGLMLPGCALFAHGAVYENSTTLILGIVLFIIPWIVSAFAYSACYRDNVNQITNNQKKYEDNYGLIEEFDKDDKH